MVGGSGGGKGGGGGAGGGAAGGGNTIRTLNGETWVKGESVAVKESPTRYTVPGTNERIYRYGDSTIATGKMTTNTDGSETHTYIMKGNKGNTYVVQETYRHAAPRFGEGVGKTYKTSYTVNRARKK